LTLDHLARFPRGLSGACCNHRLFDDGLRRLRVLFEVLAKSIVYDALDQAFHFARYELTFCLRVEARVWVFDGDDCSEALSHIVSPKWVLELPNEVMGRAIGVEGARKSRSKASEVGAAVPIMHVVRVAVDAFIIGIVPL